MGQTPPTAWPVNGSASSAASIFAFVPNCALYFALSILASPAATTSITFSFTWNDNVLAIRLSSQFNAFAASATVALEIPNSCILSSIPFSRKYSLTLSIDTLLPPSCKNTTLHRYLQDGIFIILYYTLLFNV